MTMPREYAMFDVPVRRVFGPAGTPQPGGPHGSTCAPGFIREDEVAAVYPTQLDGQTATAMLLKSGAVLVVDCNLAEADRLLKRDASPVEWRAAGDLASLLPLLKRAAAAFDPFPPGLSSEQDLTLRVLLAQYAHIAAEHRRLGGKV